MPFSSKVFNGLPHFLDLPEEQPDDAISMQPIAEVIRKHNMEGHVSIFLNHRHFELESGEQLVAQQHGDAILSEPSHNQSEVMPYIYSFSEDASGEFHVHPLELVREPGDNFVSQHDDMVSNEAFLRHYAQTLRAHNLLSKYGLALRYRDVLGNSSMETASGPRSLVVRQHLEDDDGSCDDTLTREVLFNVPDVPGVLSLGQHGCRHGSCRHCRHK